MKYFGSSGIRRKWSADLLDIAYRVGCALGNLYDYIVVGHDSRITSSALTTKLISGVLSAGGNVNFVGLAPTPLIAYSSRKYDCGVVITASHNPPEYNGIKLWNPDGSSFSLEQCEEIEKFMEKCKIEGWKNSGNLSLTTEDEDYVEDIINRIGFIDRKIVADPGNGATSYYTPRILSMLGGKVISINSHLDGNFPGRPSEPSPENLEILRKVVLKTSADIGVANDGDGDRFIAVTKKGRILKGDEILAVFLKYFGIKEIVAPVDSSMLLEEFAKVTRTKVGDAFVSMKMKEVGIKFGGENSGTQIFGDRMYAPDGVYSSALFAKIASEMDIDSIVEEFPKYHTIRKSFYYKDRDKLEAKIESFMKDFQTIKIDGWRATFEDSWLLARFSGTEPKVRITVESIQKEKAEKIMNEFVNKIKEELV